jgi:predicted RNA binding protein YcfA (HicA-like mRNA interferase family)
MAKISGINHLKAVKAFEKAGFYIARQGKHLRKRKFLEK